MAKVSKSPQRRTEAEAFSIDEFCELHRITRGFFNKLRTQGLGPRVMKVGRRVLISKEAAADWRRDREND
jgi:hypothetical protein